MKVIEFPTADRPITDELYAEAFRDLEGHISDCVTMAGIAAQCMSETKSTDEKLAFSIFHTYEMLLNLQKHYLAAYEGDNAILAKRLITSPAKTTLSSKKPTARFRPRTNHEAPAPVDQEAQPAAVGSTC
jgi:hypothetical protein